jgi:hypothetical protein
MLHSSCSGMTQLYTVSALGTLLGSSVAADAMSSSISSTACQDPISAARTLVWFRMAVSHMISAAGFLLLEWRLKAAFVQRCTGKQLVYGPFRWGQSNTQTETGVGTVRASSLQFVLSWLLVVPCLLAVVWGVALVLVPRLPKTECSFVEGYSSSNVTLSQYCGEWVLQLFRWEQAPSSARVAGLLAHVTHRLGHASLEGSMEASKGSVGCTADIARVFTCQACVQFGGAVAATTPAVLLSSQPAQQGIEWFNTLHPWCRAWYHLTPAYFVTHSCLMMPLCCHCCCFWRPLPANPARLLLCAQMPPGVQMLALWLPFR